MRKAFVFAAGLLVAGAPASAQITGKYTFEALNDNVSIPGELEITGSAPAFGGWIRWVGGQGPDSAKVNQVAQTGSNVTVVGDNQTGRWTLHLAFVADTFSGTFDGPASGELHGRRATALDITGIYDFEAGSPGGNKVGGRLVIRQTAGQYNGTVAPEGAEPAQITRLTTQGPDVTIEAGIGNGGLVMLKLRARGDSLVGTYQVTGGGNEAGDIRAGRIRR